VLALNDVTLLGAVAAAVIVALVAVRWYWRRRRA